MPEYTPKPLPEEGLRGIQAFQRAHDERFHPDVWAMTTVGQINHTGWHTVKVLGLLGDYLQEVDHGNPRRPFVEAKLEDLISKRIVDLFALSVMLANRFGIDLDEAYPNRIHGIEREKMNPPNQE